MADANELLIKTLTEALDNQQKLNSALTEQNAQLQATIKELNATIAGLNETIEYLKKKIFGTSSEKTSDPNQLTLDIFNEAEASANDTEKEPTAEDVQVSFIKKQGKRKDRKAILDQLPIKKVVCTLKDTTCPRCGAEMELIGETFLREELMIRPAKLVRVQYYQQKYGCSHCDDDEQKVIVEAPGPVALLPHSLASPSTVGYIMYRKYALYEPLYRLEQEYAQMGARISRGVMARWIIYCATKYLKPLYQLLHAELLKRDILHADEVPCQVLKEDGKTPQSKSYMWVYLTGNDGLQGIALYDYRPGRSGRYPREFLKGFKGFLHCDGYQGYNSLTDVERIGCLAHARRYFFDAIPAKKNPDTPRTPAETGVEYFNRLFMIERTLEKLPADEVKQQREAQESPVLEDFFAWIKTLHPAAGSRLDKAVTYSLNQKQNLLGYLKDGRLEISNNAAERKCKTYVMGRKNFLFHDTVDGADSSAVVYSLVETAKMNGLNVQSYLIYALLLLPGYLKESEGIEDLLPWSEYMQKACPKVKEEKTTAKPVGMK